MLQLTRTNSKNPDFLALAVTLDQFLHAIDGEDHAFYAQFNKLENIRHVVVAYESSEPVGCGAFIRYEPSVIEIKRMFVPVAWRGRGIASAVLGELEKWAREENYTASILETGKRQPAAIRLYEKSGYAHVPNFGQYVGDDNSVCLRKDLTP